jgi:tol-pal system protein YbgF
MKGKILSLVYLGLFLLGGCATYGDIRAVRDDLIRIEDKVDLLTKRLGTQTAGGGGDLTLRNQAEILNGIEELRIELQAIKGNLEKSNFKIAELSRQLDYLQTRVTGQPPISASPPVATLPGTPTPPQPPATSTSTSETETPSQTTIASIPPEATYQTAYNDYVKGNYALAILGFKEFLNKFPQAALAPNAQYWLGECYYSLKDYETAIKEFNLVVTNYPQSTKAPGALLKISYSLIELKRPAEAKAKLSELLLKYPNAPEADQAREQLQRIEN